jgi:hypothetical protein
MRQKLIAPQRWKFSHMLGGTVLDKVSSINHLGVIIFGACGDHGYKGLYDARIYQETFVGVYKSLYSKNSLPVSGSSKTGIPKLRVKHVL